ncbi:FtsW/RodA/SpoVE family cell cycle protein [Fusobacterium periodonticum]|uniref:Cell cycle protein, FtsW/RodA/SpoVE family n=1 Tax=Fusobacterium periodonticum ATCC 33693 TaxID=546275 RepID=D4CW77_9FUSO|nr:FtsW/RodA/SpoVE family cell cycle protein [Fusobacterium periodonticum]EFE86491.1 cell cycle protein, FtsW/RodA/SpoVE family [Fusobacterium periodonticum ATCC 33693]
MRRKINFNNRATDQVAIHNKINEINKEREEEKKRKYIISKRKSSIIAFFFILVLIGALNFISSISRFDNAKVVDKAIKQLSILGLSLTIFTFMCTKKFGGFFNKIVRGKGFRAFFILGSLAIFMIIAFGPSSIFPTVNGGKGWIRLGPLSLQIPELLKVPFVITIAGIFARGKDTKEKISYAKNLKVAIFYTLIFAVTITAALHDMGTAIHYVMIAAFMIFLTDIPNKVLYPIFFSLIVAIPISFPVLLKIFSGYKQHRIKVYLEGILHNNYDRVDNYQVYQSLIAFGTGGIFGKGMGNGVQKYNYIPEVETDFAIANLAEETGFVGMFIVLFLFFTLFVLIMNVAVKSKNFFYQYLVSGIAGYIITQVIINIGVAIGLIPVFGIPLPFISAGGSSILALSLSMGYVIYINDSHTTD